MKRKIFYACFLPLLFFVAQFSFQTFMPATHYLLIDSLSAPNSCIGCRQSVFFEREVAYDLRVDVNEKLIRTRANGSPIVTFDREYSALYTAAENGRTINISRTIPAVDMHGQPMVAGTYYWYRIIDFELNYGIKKHVEVLSGPFEVYE